jgi:hypothetical protein
MALVNLAGGSKAALPVLDAQALGDVAEDADPAHLARDLRVERDAAAFGEQVLCPVVSGREGPEAMEWLCDAAASLAVIP